MEGNEVNIFSKAPDRIPLFLLKTKIKQNPGCPNKEYNAIFKHIHLISGPIPKVKKYALINDYENVIAYSEDYKQSKV